MTWRTAYSIDVLRDEVNAAAPQRSRLSDGTIGDAAHASRDSDHNPWVTVDGVGVVRAADLTHDPAGGLNCDELAVDLAGLLGAHPALGSGAYIIWERRILSTDRLSEGWRDYSGSNEHRAHLHLSVARTGYDSRAPFGVLVEHEEDDMPFTEEQLRRIVREEVDAILDADLNIKNPGGDSRFRGMSVRELLKRLAVTTKAVR